MVDETKRAEAARQERMRQQAAEKTKPKEQESAFDRLLKSGKIAEPVAKQQIRAKVVTERAMEESAKGRERKEGEQRKEEGERKEKRDTRQTGDRQETRVTERGIMAKGGTKQGGSGAGGGGGGKGFGGALGRRSLARNLSKAGAKSIPVDLQQRFTSKLAQAAKSQAPADQAALTQQVINKIIQYVRIGINRAGEKEIQLELHEKIFRGLKLRVSSSGGKVRVAFQSSDEKGRKVLQSNKDALLEALEKKGIKVEEMTFT